MWVLLLGALGVAVIASLFLAAVAIYLTPAEEPTETAWEQAPPAAIAGPGTVQVEVQFVRGRGGNGQFVIEPVAEGEPIRVLGEFDPQAYRLDYGFVDDGSPGWTFRLRFIRRHWFPVNPHQRPQEVRLQLPRGLPLRLEGQVSWGESDLRLGGLSVLSVDWEVSLGTHEISFDQRLAVPMERLTASGRIGSLQVRGLGWASPSVVQLSHSLGDMAIGLEGPWVGDATITARCYGAECVVRAPDAAILTMPDGSEWSDTVAPRPVGEFGSPRLLLDAVERIGRYTIGRGQSVDVGSDD